MAALLRLAAIAFAAVAMGMSLLLLIVHLSRAGAVFGLGGLLLGAAFLLAGVRRWSAAGLALTGWVVATAGLAIYAPDGRTPVKARVQNRYVDGRDHFRRYAFGNLLPEGDQFALGFRLIPAADPLFTMKQARSLSGMTATIYTELEADPAFHALGSAMPETYDELWGLPFNHGHYYLYVPAGLDRAAPHPALVFLHGSGGNFKAYTWVLSQVADRLGLVLIAPTFGMGNWREPETTQLIQAALDDAAKVVALDRSSVHLAGLSNGGLGVSRAGRSLGERLRSLTFLSPVLDREAIRSGDFAKHWRGRPILVISGRNDDRIPIDYVAEGVETMQRRGADVTFKTVEGANHFMVFSHRAEVVETIIGWLRQNQG